eukprot:NODE_8204_length_396_cov_1.099707.p3 GENE.NODE_8204_length_396_cov_1.099707~~NODE_8204_length_396_cov_1.099707.p3  ORF type:complete len:57 (-),score=12.59 NODE_8204_length_396_cov_1.099707:137-307(-)
MASVLLQKHFPIIGVSQTSRALYFKDLEELGIISKHADDCQVDSLAASRALDDTVC